jgi:uncharacterized Ntn-hydrolase superfamily protein
MRADEDVGETVRRQPPERAEAEREDGERQVRTCTHDWSEGYCYGRAVAKGHRRAIATYSICACDLERGEWGVAVQSKFLAVGSVVTWAEAGVGAVATQAYANPRFGPEGLTLMREGLRAREITDRLINSDPGWADRQFGLVDSYGDSASFTGSACFEWAGGRTGTGYAAQGNILVSEATVDALADTFEGSTGPLAERLIACLAAAQAAGGDRRGQQSAALLVARKGGGYGGMSDVAVDLRVDDHPSPIAELERLYGLHELYFGETPEEEWVKADRKLRKELKERLAALGYEGDLAEAFRAWTGTENLEDRVRGLDRIDPVVLAELRKR